MSLLQVIFSQPPHILWLMVGLLFLGLCLVVPEPSIAALGFAAIITAIAALSVADLITQLLLWGVLAISLALVLRSMVPTRSKELEPPPEAEVSQPIPAGGVGEVFYEGSLWRARCQISDLAVAAGQTVHVVERHGNLLVVLPTVFPDINDPNIADRTV